jgi:serine/threonine protein kinase
MSPERPVTSANVRAKPAGESEPQSKPAVPDHELVRCIGAGGYGEVWLARNVLGAYRAVKVVYRQSFRDERTYEREFRGVQQFEPISRTNDGLLDILQAGRNDEAGYYYYVMELADDANVECRMTNVELPDRSTGTNLRLSFVIRHSEFYTPKTLQSEMRRCGRLPPAECVSLGLNLTLALGHLHRHGLIHRDIKPANIIFVQDIPKLADLGLVTTFDNTCSFVGTEGFIAPEGRLRRGRTCSVSARCSTRSAPGKIEMIFRSRRVDLENKPPHPIPLPRWGRGCPKGA